MAIIFLASILMSIFVITTITCPCMVVSDTTLDVWTLLNLPTQGPESLEFDLLAGGPYTGIADGRIVKYDGCHKGFVDYAYAAPNRSKKLCDGKVEPKWGPKCGRVLGLGFNHRTNELYIADAWFGLGVVGPEGGLATQIATGAEGVDFKLPDGLDVDQRTGIVYFTDASSVYNLSMTLAGYHLNDATGRVLKYDPTTKEVTVLLRNQAAPGGIAVSHDSSYLIISEFNTNRLRKYWLTGPKANTSEIIMSVPGPSNVKRTPASGNFMVGINMPGPNSTTVPAGIRIDGCGNVLETIILAGDYKNAVLNEAQEYQGKFYAAAFYKSYVGASKL